MHFAAIAPKEHLIVLFLDIPDTSTQVQGISWPSQSRGEESSTHSLDKKDSVGHYAPLFVLCCSQRGYS